MDRPTQKQIKVLVAQGGEIRSSGWTTWKARCGRMGVSDEEISKVLRQVKEAMATRGDKGKGVQEDMEQARAK